MYGLLYEWLIKSPIRAVGIQIKVSWRGSQLKYNCSWTHNDTTSQKYMTAVHQLSYVVADTFIKGDNLI